MLYYAVVFLVIALVAALLGFTGIAGAPLRSPRSCSSSFSSCLLRRLSWTDTSQVTVVPCGPSRNSSGRRDGRADGRLAGESL